MRRACKLMNEHIMSKVKYTALISLQVGNELDEKVKLKATNSYSCKLKRGHFNLISFDYLNIKFDSTFLLTFDYYKLS